MKPVASFHLWQYWQVSKNTLSSATSLTKLVTMCDVFHITCPRLTSFLKLVGLCDEYRSTSHHPSQVIPNIIFCYIRWWRFHLPYLHHIYTVLQQSDGHDKFCKKIEINYFFVTREILGFDWLYKCNMAQGWNVRHKILNFFSN